MIRLGYKELHKCLIVKWLEIPGQSGYIPGLQIHCERHATHGKLQFSRTSPPKSSFGWVNSGPLTPQNTARLSFGIQFGAPQEGILYSMLNSFTGLDLPQRPKSLQFDVF